MWRIKNKQQQHPYSPYLKDALMLWLENSNLIKKMHYNVTVCYCTCVQELEARNTKKAQLMHG